MLEGDIEAPPADDCLGAMVSSPTFNVVPPVADVVAADAIVDIKPVDDITPASPAAPKATPDMMLKFAAISGKHAVAKTPS